jgi:hypothetical protein
VLASQLPHQQVVLVTPCLAAHAFLPFDLLKGTLNEKPPRPVQRGGSVAVREGLPQIFHPISHRTPEYRMGKDSIRLLAAIKKRLNFQTQRDRKIQGKINSNSLGNRCSIRLSYETDCGSRSGCVALP